MTHEDQWGSEPDGSGLVGIAVLLMWLFEVMGLPRCSQMVFLMECVDPLMVEATYLTCGTLPALDQVDEVFIWALGLGLTNRRYTGQWVGLINNRYPV